MTSTTAADAAAPPRAAEPRASYSDGYRSLVLALLLAVYTSNFIDRTIIGIVGQAIKVDLKLTDTQLGLLSGIAFAALYAVLGVPIARLAERRSRVTIIAVCLALWSAFTALCGSATSFLTLFLFRVGVGIGEAGCSPPAHSILSDYYPRERRASALGIYAFGVPLGTTIGAVSGGWIAEHLSWRIAFMVVGLPGLILAGLVRLLVREPQRGWSETAAPAAPSETPATFEVEDPTPVVDAAATPSLAQVARTLFGKPAFLHLTAGVTLASFAGYGAGFFMPNYLIREFGLSFTVVGLVVGLIAGLSNGAGTLIGGFLTDRLGKRDPAWYALVPAIGLMIATPLYLLVFAQTSWPATAVLLLLPGVFHYTYLAPTFAVTHNLVEPRMRATATALLFLVLNLVALGGGPFFTGVVIDAFSRHAFAGAGLGEFARMCPGGVGAAGAGAALKAACHGAIAHGTRLGEIATVLIYAWAALHYALAAREIRRDPGMLKGTPSSTS